MVRPRVWSDALIQQIKLVTQVFANALARKRSDETLRKNEERLRLAMEAARAVPWALDIQNACFWLGGQAGEMFGLPPGDRLALEDFIGLVHPEDRPMIRRAIEGALRSRELAVVEYRIARPDGQVRWMVSRGRHCAPGAGSPGDLVGITSDITASKQTEESRARADRQSQLILETVAEGVMGLGLAERHVFVNPAAAKMLGYATEALVGRNGHDIWHHSRADGKSYPPEECPICTTCRDGVEHHVTGEVFWRKDGTSFPVEYKSTPILEDGRHVGAVVTFEDITERIERERELRETAARTAAAIDVAELGTYEVLNGVRVTFADDRACEILGVPRANEEAGRIMEFWMERIHPEDVGGIMKFNRELNEGERDRVTATYRFLHLERGVVHIHHLAHVIEHDAAGRAVRTIGVLQDITALKRNEDELRRALDEIRQLRDRLEKEARLLNSWVMGR
jgi:PAS domain S-box-containing protein